MGINPHRHLLCSLGSRVGIPRPHFLLPTASSGADWHSRKICCSIVESGLDFFGMTHAQAKARHAELVEEVRKHDHLYYVQATPQLSDREYDALYRQLLDLETEFPVLVTPDSPTQRVGGQPIKA